jgi:hypothetical protein
MTRSDLPSVSLTEYQHWAAGYVNRVGINYDGGIDMVMAWWPDIQASKIDLATLTEAGNLAAGRITRNPPDKREQHRGILFHAIDFAVMRQRGTPTARQTRELCDQHRPGDTPEQRQAGQSLWRQLCKSHGWKLASAEE